jgi:hypothetical protein
MQSDWYCQITMSAVVKQLESCLDEHEADFNAHSVTFISSPRVI